MKKQTVNNFKKLSLMLCALFISALALGGCSTLSYSGDDYNALNAAPVQTEEQFYFSTYNKTSAQEDISMRIGISKTAVPDVLVTYIQINNNSSANDYVFYLKDFVISAQDTVAETIQPSNYLGAYQSSQAGALASMSQASGAFNSLATIATTYQRLNQTSPTVESSNVSSDDSAYKQISSVVEGVSAHTINNAAVIKPGENKFFYVFVKDPNVYPIKIEYKDLTYSFMVKGNPPSDDE